MVEIHYFENGYLKKKNKLYLVFPVRFMSQEEKIVNENFFLP